MGKITDLKIIDFIRRAKKEYNIKLAILFGSRARGDNFKNSDYNIIIVSKDFRGIFLTQRIANMYKFWKYYPIEIEPLCYTPEEFEKKKKQIGIVKEAIKEGIEIK